MSLDDIEKELIQPNDKAINDGYKLALIAAQLERTEDGKLDFASAYEAWMQGIEFVNEQQKDKNIDGLRFDSLCFNVYKLGDALEHMGFTYNNDSQWKDTFRKKFRKFGMPEEDIKDKLEFWEKFGVPSYELKAFINDRVNYIENTPIKPRGKVRLYPNKGQREET